MESSTSNKRWWHRLNVVTTLSEWVEANLSSQPVVWEGQERDKKRTCTGRKMKAAQYVYAHLMLGRMYFPCTSPSDDPLFCAKDFPNESMELQLRKGAYPEFQAQVRLLRQRVLDPRAVTTIPTVTWEMVLRRVNPCIIPRLEKFAAGFSLSTDALIGLVLRYLCVGGLDDTLHASITIKDAEVFGEDCVECFASPFNHKFKTYYSFFDEDRILGSQGNFFRTVAAHGGSLPRSFRRYEMNPPWINAVYEHLVGIIGRSISERRDLEVLVIAPQWTSTRWTPAFTSLVSCADNAPYAYHSLAEEPVHLPYVHDLSEALLFFRTVVWFFTCSELPPALRERLSRKLPASSP
jgi:hypothetical protein